MNEDYNHVLDAVRKIVEKVQKEHYMSVSSQCLYPELDHRVYAALFGEERLVDGKPQAIQQTMWDELSLIASRVVRSSFGSKPWMIFEARWADPQRQTLVYIACTVGVSVRMEVFAFDGVHRCAEATDGILARLNKLASQRQDPSE